MWGAVEGEGEGLGVWVGVWLGLGEELALWWHYGVVLSKDLGSSWAFALEVRSELRFRENESEGEC